MVFPSFSAIIQMWHYEAAKHFLASVNLDAYQLLLKKRSMYTEVGLVISFYVTCSGYEIHLYAFFFVELNL